ncbi:hypothetical protein [Actinobaculum sp. 313]|uniref:hypothetical protein n=1 Tax=Actinobaculum sp. 313 TaxID=2495645 RepID=UPI000F73FB97|nr:hypothetical protein [Actinobaculum sp. 313]
MGRSPIDGWLTGMAENLDAMSGHVVEDFKTKFLTQLGVAMMGQHDIAVVWAATLAAEKGAFEAARASVVDAIQQATAACDKAAIQSYGDIKMALRVADWALKAVSSFTSAGATAILALTGLGLEVVKTFAEEIEELDEEVYVYEEAMVAFEKALAQVNAELIEVEEQVRANLLYNLEAIRSRKGAFDLTIKRTENNGSQDLQVERGLVNEITNSYMPMIADELKGIAYRIPGVSMKMAVLRDGHIGIGEQGPSGPFGEMRILLEELVRDLSWEVEKGAEDLRLAVQAIVDRDSEAQRRWDELDSFLDGGSGIDPWNDEHERDTRERP